MFSFRFLSLKGGSLLLLLSAVCAAEYEYDNITPSDYEYDNSTFVYSFFSNTSTDELEKFSEHLFNSTEGELDDGEDETGDQVGTVTTATIGQSTQRTKVNVHSSASLPICLEIRTLVWTLTFLMVLDTQQL